MWKPRSDLALRERLGIKKDIFLMLICGTNLIEDKRKGIDLLEKALSNVSLPSNKVAIGFLGCDSFPKNYKFSGLNTFPLGRYSNPDDLIDAYNNNLVSGFALDVFENEPIIESLYNKISGDMNCILTPHISGVTSQSNERVCNFIANKTIEFFKT